MGKSSNTGKLIIYILVAIVGSSLVATLILHPRGPSTNKIPDTDIRTRLRKQANWAQAYRFLEWNESTSYSNLIYDYEINKPFSGMLPWSDSSVQDPNDVFSLVVRIKLTFKAKFSTLLQYDPASDYSVKVINRNGLPVYERTKNFVLPNEEIYLTPGIYVAKLTSTSGLDFLTFNFAPLEKDEKLPVAESEIFGLRTVRFMAQELAMRELVRLVEMAKKSSKTSIIKTPKGRIQAILVGERGQKIADVRVGLSGRTREHLKWFPSVDVRMRRGQAFAGTTSFKLYRLETKSGLYDFVFLSVLRDMGYLVPRQEIVELVLNNEPVGLYILVETPSPPMFSAQGRLEGNVVGTDADKLFFDYPIGGQIAPRYYYELQDSHLPSKNATFFLSKDFARRLESTSFAQYLAFASAYYTSHGLGVDDLRFYEDPETNSFEPIPRDLNPGCWSVSQVYRAYLSHVAWLPNQPLYTIWPIKRLLSDKYQFSRDMDLFSGTYRLPTATGVTDIHFSIAQFLSDPENLSLTNNYLHYFANNSALNRQMFQRLINTLNVVLKKEPGNSLLSSQLDGLIKNGVPFFGEFLNRQLLDSGLYLSEAHDIFFWNARTALSLRPGLLPSFMSPVADGSGEDEYEKQLKLCFLCEKNIFSLLRKHDIHLSGETFVKVESPDDANSVFDLDHMLEEHVHSGRVLGSQQEVSNVMTYLGTHTVDNKDAVVLFLVRNATDDVTEYAINTRDGMVSFSPDVNSTFQLIDTDDMRTASLRQIMMNHFEIGEKLRLVAFTIGLSEKALFYTPIMPNRSHFLFPPYLFLPTKSGTKAADNYKEPREKDFIRSEDGFHVPENSNIRVEGDLVIPEGRNLYIHEGSTFMMRAGSSIKITGDLYVLGTEKANIKFLSEDEEAWGGICAAGSPTKKIKVVLRHAEIDNFGKWPKTRISTSFLNGGLTFYHADVDIENVRVSNAGSEDAINLISSTANISNLEISDCYSDCIDLDFTDAVVRRLRTMRSGGDGMDLSGSIVKCVMSEFKDCKDKGVSVGEMSNVIIGDSMFDANNFGIANKDQSVLHVSNCFFDNNRIAIAEYIKKPYFGRPKCVAEDNGYKNNGKKHQWLGLYGYWDNAPGK